MGQPKQLLLFRGKALVQHAVEIAVATGCTAIYLVVNPEEQSAIRQAFKQSQDRSNDKSNDEEEHHRFPVDVSADDVALLVNESFTDGISTSIRLATTIVSAKPEIWNNVFKLRSAIPHRSRSFTTYWVLRRGQDYSLVVRWHHRIASHFSQGFFQ
jgi:hypothetical protein